MKHHDIELDFDGTMVFFQYPNIGAEVYNAVKVVKRLQKAGHTIWLNTMRADLDPKTFTAAKEWLADRGIFCEARASKRHPGPFREGGKLKVYNDPQNGPFVFIDDSSDGIPLTGKAVDWRIVEQVLEANNFFT